MNFLDKLEKLASIYLAEAQTLGLGESSLSLRDMQGIALSLKNKVEQLVKDKKIPHHMLSWTNPADKLISALDKMNNGLALDTSLKAEALNDYNLNVSSFLSLDDRKQLEKLFSVYNIY